MPLLAGLGAGKRKDIIKREFAFARYHLLQLRFMFAVHGRRVQDSIDERGGDKSRVLPFSVIANSNIQNVYIFKAVSWRNVEKEKAVEYNEQYHQQPY